MTGVTRIRNAAAACAVVVLAVLELGLPGLDRDLIGPDGAAVGLVLLAAVVWRVSPRAAGGIAVTAGVVGFAAVAQALAVPSLVGLLGVAGLVRYRTPAVAVVGTVALAVAVMSWHRLALGGVGLWLVELVIATALVAAVAATTSARNSRRDAARAEALLREQEIVAERRDAALGERSRIGRELHDVVAHSVSVIASLAETAPYAVADLPAAARDKFAEIAQEARGALGELRDLLSALRRDGTDTAQGLGPHPVPDLAGVEYLVDDHRRAGGHADLARVGELSGIPVAVEIAAHRIVQEALTNVRRHTVGAHATVTLTRTPDRLLVRVRDTGPRRPAGPEEGHGVIGMRERAAALRGTLRAEPLGDGFEVAAELPIDGGQR